MNVKKKKLAIALYVFLFLVFAAFFTLRNLNDDFVREKLENAIKDNSGFTLTASSFSHSLPFSVTMKDAAFSTADGKSELKFDSLEIRPVIWKLLFLHPTVRINFYNNEGWARIDLSRGFFPAKILAEVESVKFPLGKAFPLLDGKGLPLEADADMLASVTVPIMDSSEATGTLVFTLNDLKLTTGTAWDALLANLIPKTTNCSLEVKNRELTTKKCSAGTEMGNLELRISAKLSPNISLSQLSGAIVINPSQKLGNIMELLYEKYRKPDGAFYIPISGTPNNPKLGL
jgi:type II secretion system protein N